MIKYKKNYKTQGFSLIETLVYIFITAMLLTTISSLILSNFNIRRQLKTSSLIYNDARFIIGQLNNKIHSAPVIEDVRPDAKQIIFYAYGNNEFSLQVEDENLVYREDTQVGGGSPVELVLNSEQTRVSNFILTPVNDGHGNANKGVLISFNLSTGVASDIYGYLSEDFETFISLR